MQLFLVGGFLGSGKTTAITNACTYLQKTNKKVAVITNDQGDQQVDSALVKYYNIPNREVVNGCFCCNYNQLGEHIQSLRDTERPDIIFAESVGTCTDLVATVAKPFGEANPGCGIVITVFTDASLLLALLTGNAGFISENVRYIYKKQLEETDILVINKTDLVTAEQLEIISRVLSDEYPGKVILHQDSYREEDIQHWVNTLRHFQLPGQRQSLFIDYDLYGDGEAQLAWLDQSMILSATQNNAVEMTDKIIYRLHQQLLQQDLVIGHLKFFVSTGLWQKKISITSQDKPGLGKLENYATAQVHLLLNARVQTDPETLQQITNDVLKQVAQEAGGNILVEKSAAFKPGYPEPVHRIS